MKKHRFNLLLVALFVALATLSAACGSANVEDGDPQGQAASVAPSLEEADGFSDAPTFPNVTDTENPLVPPEDVTEALKIVWEAWELLQQDYVDRSELDPEAFSEQAIRGMLTVLEDRQTSYVSPATLKGSFGDTFTGAFEGIGAHVNMNLAGKLVIVSPIEDSPAEEAGIRTGDIILEADGETLEGLSLLEAVSKIRGPRGSVVELLVKHLGAIDPLLISVTRGRIPLKSVYLRSEPGDTFTHIRISQFFPNTIDTLKDVLTDEIKAGSQGLVLDLRDNPGGILDSVVDVASQFLDDGLVLYVQDGDGERTDWKVRNGGVAKDIPMVVLVNGGSGSSSEVLAGALQDHGRATVIGDTTFGKGSVNILRPLSNEGGLYITIAHWYTPRGRLIQNEGIEPDIQVTARDVRDADVKQLKTGLAELERITGAKQS